jgi:hypothetical protein
VTVRTSSTISTVQWVQKVFGPLDLFHILLRYSLILKMYEIVSFFQDIQRLVPKPLLRCLGCVLRVVVLLEGETSPQSEVLSAMVHLLFKVLSLLCSVNLSLDPDYSPRTLSE